MYVRNKVPTRGIGIVPAYSPTTASTLEDLLDGEVLHVYPPKVTLLDQGQTLSNVGLIRAGIVRLSAVAEDGSQQILGLRAAGWWLNGTLAYLGLPSPYQVTTVTTCEISVVRVSQFTKQLSNDEKMAQHFYSAQCRELISVQQRSIMQERSAGERLSYLLDESANSIWDTRDPALVMSQSEIATLLGISAEHLSRLRSRRMKSRTGLAGKPFALGIVATPSSSFPSEVSRRHSVTITGTDGPLVVLLHGFGTNQTVWNEILPALEPRFRVLRLDLAGAGDKGTKELYSSRYASIEAHVDDLLRVLDDRGVVECRFVGASMGAMVGMLASIRRPKLFKQLICIAASPRYLNDRGYVGGFDQQSLDALYEMMSLDYKSWISSFAPIAVRGPVSGNAVRLFTESLSSLRPEVALSLARSVFQSDFRPQMKEITRPVTLLQMQNDLAVPCEVGYYLKQVIPGATLEVLPIEGHLPHLSAPVLLSGTLLRHLV